MLTSKTVSGKRAGTMRRVISALLLIVLVTAMLPTSALAANTTYEYKVVKVKDLSKELCKEPFATTTGSPGVTVAINKTKAVSRTYSYSITGKISYYDINLAIGWSESTSDQVSVTNGGSWKVPKKVNGKKVKLGILNGYVYMDRVEYKIMRRSVTRIPRRGHITFKYGQWEDYKTGCIACMARTYDVYYKTSVKYK